MPVPCNSAAALIQDLDGVHHRMIHSRHERGRQLALTIRLEIPERAFRYHAYADAADLVKASVAKLGIAGPEGTWFDTAAFARPTGARFGNVGRNTMRGPGVINTDLSLFRTFKLTEKFNLQFRGESFNLSNTPHFSNPSGNANSSNFGKVLSTRSSDVMGRSREFRFGLRLGF